jgi:hypothetical protein
MRLSLRRTAPALILVALVGLAYLPLLLGGVLYQRDVTRHTYPSAVFLANSLSHGEPPWWNPRIGLGVSTLSNPLNQIFYPPNALQVALCAPRATSFFLIGHLVLGALGMMALVRRLRPTAEVPSMIAGLAWALSGCCTSGTTAGLLAVAGAYLPWCTLGLLHVARTSGGWRQRSGAIASAALPFALLLLTGEVFIALFACAFAAVVVAGDALETPPPSPRSSRGASLGRALVGTTLALVLAAGCAAVMLVPVERAAQATARRAPLPAADAEVGSFHPWRLAELVAPGALGDPYLGYPAGAWVGEPGLGQRPLLYGVYVGSSVLVLALLGLGRGQKLAATLAAMAALALLVAMGRYTGAHTVVRFLVPPLRYMRGPEKYLVIVQACLALLAGLGAARVQTDAGGRPPWRRGACVVVSLLVLALASPRFPMALVSQLRTSALVGAAVAALATLLAWLGGRRLRMGVVLLVGLVVVDLSSAVFALQNFGSADLLAAEPAAAAAVRADARARGELAPPRVYRSEGVDAAIERMAPPTSLSQVQRNLTGTLIDNHAGVFGIATVPGYDAASPETLTSLWLAGRGHGTDLLRLTGTAYAILPTPEPPDPHLRPLLAPAPGTSLVFVEGALPRVYAARSVAVLPDAQARYAVFSPDVVNGRRVVLAAAPPVALPTDSAEDSPGTCRLVAYANTRIEAKCTVAATSLAVFVEQFADGWSATVDGQPAPILRANLAMRAVPVQPGEHRIALSFSPPRLGFALAVSATAATLLAFLLIWAWLAPRPRPSV